MGIKTIEECVQAVRIANENGVLSVCDNKIHLTNQAFEELLLEVDCKFKVVKHVLVKYPFEVSFVNNDLIYMSLYSEQEFKNKKFGGISNELITTN